MKNLYLTAYLLFFSIGLFAGIIPQFEMDEAFRQFEIIQKYNERNLINGCPEKNIYFFNYKSGQKIIYDEASNNLRFDYFLISNPKRISDQNRINLNQALVNFNAGTNCTNNPYKVYAFLINDFIWKMSNSYLTAAKGPSSAIEDLKGKDTLKAKYRAQYISEFKNKMDGFTANDIFLSNQNNLVIYGGVWRGEHASTTFGHWVFGGQPRGTLIEGNSAGRVIYQRIQENKRTYPTEATTMFDKKYYNAIHSTIEFLCNPDIQSRYDNNCDESFQRIVIQVNSELAQDFLLDRCQAILKDETTKYYALRAAKIMDELADTPGLFDDFDDMTNLTGEVDNYIDYVDNLQGQVDYKNKILSQLDDIIADEDRERLHTFLWNHSGDENSILFNNMSEAQRVSSLNLLAAGKMYGSDLFNGRQEEFAYRLFETVPQKEPYVSNFLAGIQNNSNLIRNLFNKIDDFGGPDNFTKFIRAINELVWFKEGKTKDDDFSSLNISDGFVWTNNFANSSRQGNTYYQNLEIQTNGDIKFSQYSCTESEYIHPTSPGPGTWTCTATPTTNHTLQPFQLIKIVLEDNPDFFECGELANCSTKYIVAPAIFLAYVLQKDITAKTIANAKTVFYVGAGIAIAAAIVVQPGLAAALPALLSKAGRDCGIGMAFDAALQMGINYYAGKEDWGNINEVQNVTSCLESVFESDKHKALTLITQMGLSCVAAGYYDNDGKPREEFATEECAKGAAIAGVVNLLIDGGGKIITYVKKLPREEQVKFITNLGQEISTFLSNKGVDLPQLSCGLAVIYWANYSICSDLNSEGCYLWSVYSSFFPNVSPDFPLIKEWLDISEDIAKQLADNLDDDLTKNLFENGFFQKIKYDIPDKIDREKLIQHFLDGEKGKELLLLLNNNSSAFTAWTKIAKSNFSNNLYWIKRITKWEEKFLVLKFVPNGNKLLVKDVDDELVAEIAEDLFTIKFKGFGDDIVCPINKTVTIIGLFRPGEKFKGVQYLKEVLEMWETEVNLGGINLFSMPGGGWQWASNKSWLQRAINRGDIIRIISNPIPRNNTNRTLFNPDRNKRTITSWEIEWMTGKMDDPDDLGWGYEYNPNIPGYTKTIE